MIGYPITYGDTLEQNEETLSSFNKGYKFVIVVFGISSVLLNPRTVSALDTISSKNYAGPKTLSFCSPNRAVILLFIIACYGFYLMICLGYFLSKIYYNFFHKIIFENIHRVRNKLNLENIKKFIINYILKNWFTRIKKKFYILIKAIIELIKGLKDFRNKFKSMLELRYDRYKDNFRIILLFKKSQYNFELFKELFLIFWSIPYMVILFLNDLRLFFNIIIYLNDWKIYLGLLTSKRYILYLILLCLFGILVGFLLGSYRRRNYGKYDIYDIYGFILLILLKMLYNNELNSVLFEPSNVNQFFKFSLEPIQEIKPRFSRLNLKTPDRIPLPSLIIEDPSVFIETDILWEQSTNYKIEFFKFYQNIKENVKS